MTSENIQKRHYRLALDVYFMRIAETVSLRSPCVRHTFGAILVREKRILSTGYNGPPSGLPHCPELPDGCIRDFEKIKSGTQLERCRAVHAEVNAILQCSYHGVSSKGATLYVTGCPCLMCARTIINAGVTRLFYKPYEYGEEGLEILREAGIECVPFP